MNFMDIFYYCKKCKKRGEDLALNPHGFCEDCTSKYGHYILMMVDENRTNIQMIVFTVVLLLIGFVVLAIVLT